MTNGGGHHAAVALSAVALLAACAHVQRSDSGEPIRTWVGCYTLRWQDDGLGLPHLVEPTSRALEISGGPGRSGWSNSYVWRSVEDDGKYDRTWTFSSADSVEIGQGTAFEGVVLRARRDAQGFRGVARASSDAGIAPPPEAAVSGVRVTCPDW